MGALWIISLLFPSAPLSLVLVWPARVCVACGGAASFGQWSSAGGGGFVLFGDALFALRPEFYATVGGWCARRGFGVSLGFRLVRLPAAPGACPTVLGTIGPFAMAFVVGVAFGPSTFPALAGDTVWDPHLVVWILILPDFPRVLPIIFGRECLHPRHVEFEESFGALGPGPFGVPGCACATRARSIG